MSYSIESEHVRLPAPGERHESLSFEPLIPSPYGVDIDLEVICHLLDRWQVVPCLNGSRSNEPTDLLADLGSDRQLCLSIDGNREIS